MAIEQSKLYPRVRSGIPGFDEMVAGGFHRGTVNTITGPSGSGKTVFASQFIYEGAKSGDKCMIITPSESSDFLKREMSASFGWDFSRLEKEKKLSIIDVTDPVLRLQKSIDADPVEFLVNFRKLVERKLEEEKLRLTNDKLRFQLQVMQREYSRNSDIELWVGDLVMQAKRVLLAIPSKLAPQIVGLTEVEAELRLKEEINTALAQLTSRPLHGDAYKPADDAQPAAAAEPTPAPTEP